LHNLVAGLLADLSVTRVPSNYDMAGVDFLGDSEMPTAPDVPSAKLVVVIDDDPMVLEGMSGLLRSWGYQVLTAATEDAALASLAAQGRRPDLIVCDYRLAGGRNGVQAVEQVREAFEIPALIITGGVAPARPQERRVSRYELMHKPVDPTALHETLREALKRSRGTDRDS
jgi:two-component system, sensor histidine kinase